MFFQVAGVHVLLLHRQSSFLPPQITDASEQAPGSRWGPASLFAEVYVPPGG
jgi:hypothetical protein